MWEKGELQKFYVFCTLNSLDSNSGKVKQIDSVPDRLDKFQ